MSILDHLVLAASDLQAAKLAFESATGVMPVDGGAHDGWGTRNALVSLGTGTYLEIIAPDPDQTQVGNLGGALSEHSSMTPFHWAVRVNDLVALSEDISKFGLIPGEIRSMSRIQPNGARIAWKLMGVGGHPYRGLVPFCIDWMESRHPSMTIPVAARLAEFEVRVPDGATLQMLQTVEGVSASKGPQEFRFVIDTGVKQVAFQANELLGFDF